MQQQQNANAPMSPDVRSQIREGNRKMIADILRYARNNPRRVWANVVALDYELNREVRTEKLKSLAKRLGVSSARASQVTADAAETIYNSTSLPPLSTPCK